LALMGVAAEVPELSLRVRRRNHAFAAAPAPRIVIDEPSGRHAISTPIETGKCGLCALFLDQRGSRREIRVRWIAFCDFVSRRFERVSELAALLSVEVDEIGFSPLERLYFNSVLAGDRRVRAARPKNPEN
jgi:hypothetical protein